MVNRRPTAVSTRSASRENDLPVILDRPTGSSNAKAVTKAVEDSNKGMASSSAREDRIHRDVNRESSRKGHLSIGILGAAGGDVIEESL